MALLTETFGVFTDSDCTIQYGGIEDLIHKTDLSDGSQDIAVVYLGSAVVSPTLRQLQDTSSPGVSNIIITPIDILDSWAALTAYIIGDAVQPLASPNGKRYVCTTAGTSSATEGAFVWPTLGIGSTVLDGTVVWELKGAKHETTEVKLSTTAIGLDTAVAGASLSLGNTIDSDPSNAATIYVRVTNAVTNISNNTATPEIDIQISNVTEFEA